jgi:hypothetical protein
MQYIKHTWDQTLPQHAVQSIPGTVSSCSLHAMTETHSSLNYTNKLQPPLAPCWLCRSCRIRRGEVCANHNTERGSSPFTTRVASWYNLALNTIKYHHYHISVGWGLRRDILVYLLIFFKLVCKLFEKKLSDCYFRRTDIITAITTVVTTSKSNYSQLFDRKHRQTGKFK